MVTPPYPADEGADTQTPRPALTPTERDLLRLLLRGETPPEMARTLGTCLADVEAALEALQRRAGVASWRHLLVHALLHGWSGPGW